MLALGFPVADRETSLGQRGNETKEGRKAAGKGCVMEEVRTGLECSPADGTCTSQ